MNKINEITKLIFDDISYEIIKETSYNILTTKELSEKLKISSSNLYYKINKLLKVDALRIKKQQKIGNLIENSYSSEHLFSENMIINNEYLRDNFDSFLHYYLLNQKNVLNLLEEDLKTEGNEDHVKIILGNVRLTQEDWSKFHELVENFLQTHEKNSDDVSTVELVITGVKKKRSSI
ncbi:hypothetical protein ACRS42_27380 [Bacillus thuringiensis]|uniref:hypothetical protein n=1 Tax=Bacillus thuringiensis TaxID=1428 RepID=UPI003EDEEA2F